MKSSAFKLSALFRQYNLLSKEVAVQEPFLKQTACMSKENREMYAFCEIYREMNPKDTKFNEFLRKVQRAIQLIGMANWERTEISDLGFKSSSKKEGGSLKKLKDTMIAPLKSVEKTT